MEGSNKSTSIDLRELYEMIMDRKEKNKNILSKIKNKQIFYPFGYTGAGKTTFILFAFGIELKELENGRYAAQGELPPELSHLQIGQFQKSCTVYVSATCHENIVFLDGPGFKDTEGPIIDIANVVAMHMIFQEIPQLTPILFIDYALFQVARGSALRDLVAAFAGMWGNNTRLLEENMVVVFTKVPDDVKEQQILDLVDGVVKVDTNANTREVKDILEAIADGLLNYIRSKNRGMSDRVLIFRPLDSRLQYKVEKLFDKIKQIDDPKDRFCVSLPEEAKLILENSMNLIKIQIPQLLESGDSEKIATFMLLLKELSVVIPSMNMTLDYCAENLYNTLVKTMGTSKENLNVILQDGVIVNVAMFSSILNCESLLKKIEQLRPFLAKFDTLEEFYNGFLSKIKHFIKHTIELESYHIIGLNLEKMDQLCKHLIFLPYLKNEYDDLSISIKKKVQELGKKIQEMKIISGTIGELEDTFQLLIDASSHVQTYINFDCSGFIDTVVVDINKRITVIASEIIKLVDKNTPSNIDLKYIENYNSIKLISSNKNLVQILNRVSAVDIKFQFPQCYETVKKVCLDSSRESLEILKQVGSGNSLPEKSAEKYIMSIKEIAKFDPEISEETAVPLAQIVSTFEHQVDTIITSVQSLVLFRPEGPDFKSVPPLIQRLDSCIWIDQYSFGGNRIERKKKEVTDTLVSSLKNITTKIRNFYKKSKYDLVEEHLEIVETDLSPLQSVLRESYEQEKENITSYLIDELKIIYDKGEKKSHLPKPGVENEPHFTLAEADIYLGTLKKIESLSKQIGQKDIHDQTVKKVDNFLSSLIKGWINEIIIPNEYKFDRYSIILDDLLMIKSKTDFPNLSDSIRVYEDGVTRVRMKIRGLVDEVEKYVESQKLDKIPQVCGILENSYILITHLSDIVSIVQMVKDKRSSSVKNLADDIKSDFNLGDYLHLKNKLDVLPTEQSQQSIRFLLNSFQNMANNIKRDISFFKVFPSQSDVTSGITAFDKIRRDMVKFEEGKVVFQDTFKQGTSKEDFFSKSVLELYSAWNENFKSELTLMKEEQGPFQTIEKKIGIINRMVQSLSEAKMTQTAQLIKEMRNSAGDIFDKMDDEIKNIEDNPESIEQFYIELNDHPKKGVCLINIKKALNAIRNSIKDSPTIHEAKESLGKLENINLTFTQSELKKIIADITVQAKQDLKARISQKENDFDSILISLNGSKIVEYLKSNKDDSTIINTSKVKLNDHIQKLFCNDPYTIEAVIKYSEDLCALKIISDSYPDIISLSFIKSKSIILSTKYHENLNILQIQLKSDKSSLNSDMVSKIVISMKFLIEIKSRGPKLPITIDPSKFVDCLSEICKIFTNNKLNLDTALATCDLFNLYQTIRLIQNTDTLMQQLQFFVKGVLDAQLGPLKTTLDSCLSFDQSKMVVSKWISELIQFVKTKWDLKEYPPIFKIINGAKSDQHIKSLKVFFPNIEDTFKEVTRTIRTIYEDLGKETILHFNNENWPKFTECYSIINNTSTIESIFNDLTYSTEIKKLTHKKINDIRRGYKNDDKSVVDTVVYLNELGQNIPQIGDNIKQATNDILIEYGHQGDDKIYAVGKILENYEGPLSRNARDVLASNKIFSTISMEIWQAQTKGQTIDWALDKDPITNLPRFMFINPPEGERSIWKFTVELFTKWMHFYNDKNKKFIQDFMDDAKEFQNIFKSRYDLVLTGAYIPVFETKNIIGSRLSKKDFINILVNIAIVWSRKKSVNRKRKDEFILQLHPIQILCLLRMTEYDDKTRKFNNQLIEVLTGEGKSVILGILSTFFALLGNEVQCICYSEYLCRRDHADFIEVFNEFGVEKFIEYSTITEMCEKMINYKGSVRDLTKSVIEGSTVDIKTAVSNSNKKRVLLIDEVDVFFGASFYGNTYNPATLISNDDTYGILEFIFTNRANVNNSTVINTKYYRDLTTKYPKLKPLIDCEIKKMLKDITIFEDTPEKPIVMNNKICYKDQDSISERKVYGYKTSFQYFQKKMVGEITGEIKERIGIYIGCGHFSFAEIPNKFDYIMGVSGTLHSLTPEEQEIISKYNIQKLAYAPSIYGGSKLNEKSGRKSTIVIVNDKNDWFLRIVQTCQGKQSAGRAVLIFFENITVLNEFYSQNKSSLKNIQILEEKIEFKENIIKKATFSGTVTLCTRPFGRGIDFICLDPKTKSSDGVHIIQTFVSACEAEQIQINGRTARQGDPGSHEYYLFYGDLLKNLGTREGEPDNTGFKDWNKDSTLSLDEIAIKINKLRDRLYSAEVSELEKKKNEAKIAYEYTLKFYEVLLKYDNTDQSRNLIVEHIMEMNKDYIQSLQSKYHLYFCLDDSGSMSGQPWTDLLKAVGAFIAKRIELSNSSGNKCEDLVTVVNYASDSTLVMESQPIDPQIPNRIKYRGGGTEFSAGLNTILQSLRKTKSPNYVSCLLFMSDGGSNSGDNEMKLIRKEFPEIKIYVIGFSSGCDRARMNLLASCGQGQFFFGTDGVELKSAFETISINISGGYIYDFE